MYDDDCIFFPQISSFLVSLWENSDTDRAVHILKPHDAHRVTFFSGNPACLDNRASNCDFLLVQFFGDFGYIVRYMFAKDFAEICQWVLRGIHADQLFFPAQESFARNLLCICFEGEIEGTCYIFYLTEEA